MTNTPKMARNRPRVGDLISLANRGGYLTDDQLNRLIESGLTRAQRKKYRAARPEVITAFLEQIVAGGPRQ
jgi:hypothetical protein